MSKPLPRMSRPVRGRLSAKNAGALKRARLTVVGKSASSVADGFRRGSAEINARNRRTSGGPRSLPAVEKVLQLLGPMGLPRPTLVHVVRKELAELRQKEVFPELKVIVDGIRLTCERLKRSRLQPVINGTGIVLHTNLGRAPLGARVIERMAAIAASYNNVEYNLGEGGRGCRAAYQEANLAVLCEAEAATAVNNCAAALVLVLRHFTREKPEVIISRGELIQIGGGFRIPEILEASGARLKEIGTTNKTSIGDYARAIGPQTGLILKVHRSNFVMDGFVESVGTGELAALGREKDLAVVEDLGSGAMIRTETIPGLGHEPTPAEILRQGVSLVTFSGDKLLGGPQAGIIAGKSALISALKGEPFFRALRCDKLILSALETTAELYLEGAPQNSIPLWAMLHTTEEELRHRADWLAIGLKDLELEVRVGKGKSQAGGGSLPRSVVPSVTLDLQPRKILLGEFAERMSTGLPPVIGCLSAGWYKLDLRTVFPGQDQSLAKAIRAAVG